MTSTFPAQFDPASVHREQFVNGLTVLVRTDHSAPVVAIVTYVKAGYFDETDDVSGIAHVLEHMYFKGTTERGVGEIARETKSSGGYLNAHTIYDHTSYFTVLPSSGFRAGLDIQFDAYANSVIDAGELAKELEVIVQEARRKSDNAGAVTTETLYALLHDRHRIRRWRIGHEAGLRALGRDDLVRFYRNFYRPSNTILIVAGDVGADEAVEHVRERYGALPGGIASRSPGPVEPPGEPGFRYRELSGDVRQTQLSFGWRAPGALHEDSPLLDVAASVLASGRSSRLYRAVRERRLASSATAYHYTPTDIGVFAVHTEGAPESAADAARAAWSEVKGLRTDGADAGELERAQRMFEARWARRIETVEGQASHLAEWEALGDWRLGDAYAMRVLAATPGEVTAAVRRHLDPDRAGMVVYRPGDAPVVATDAEAMREVLERGRGQWIGALTSRISPSVPVQSEPLRADREEAGVRVYRTDGGVPVLIKRRLGAGLVYLGVYARGGAVHEDAHSNGITSLLVRTAVKGTTSRSAEEIAEAAELLGGGVQTSVSGEQFGWGISVPTANFAAAAELLADVALSPTVPDAAFETERSVSLEQLAALHDDMYRYPMRLANAAAFAGHQYASSAMGSLTSLPLLTAVQARAWHMRHLLRGAPVIALVGDVEPDMAAGVLAKLFAPMRWHESLDVPEPVWRAGATAVESRDKAQTALAMLFTGPLRNDPDRFAAGLIAGIASGLGGRFFDELRDRQSLAYTVTAFATERPRAGIFGAYIATDPARESVARDGLLREFARLANEPVTAEELSRAQRYAIGARAIRQESGGAVLGEIVEAWLFGAGLEDLTAFEERVRAVTVDDIQRVARKHFDPAQRVEGIVRGTARQM